MVYTPHTIRFIVLPGYKWELVLGELYAVDEGESPLRKQITTQLEKVEKDFAYCMDRFTVHGFSDEDAVLVSSIASGIGDLV